MRLHEPTPTTAVAPAPPIDVETDRDLVAVFAEHATRTRFEDLPASAVQAARNSLLDTLGVILAAGGTEPAAEAVLDHVREAGGRPQARILGSGERVPAAAAALANGALAHCLDFDDQTVWGQHCASSVVPTVLALAEARGAVDVRGVEGRGVDGREILRAIAVGQDVFARLRRHVDWRKDWNLSTVLGVFAATVAGALVTGLDTRRVEHAMGVASMQCSGVMEVVAGTGSDLRALYAGFSAQGAVLATRLAARGVSGVERLFEGPDGVFAAYFGGGYDRAAMVADLGQDYRGALTSYKKWPAVGTSHSHITAVIDLVRRLGARPAEIEQIRVHVGDYHQLMCEPLVRRRAPTTAVDAKFSLPYLVAVAAVRGTVRVQDLTVDALGDPVVAAVARTVVPVPAPELSWTAELPPGRVELVLRDGRRETAVGDPVPGSPAAPLGFADVAAKFTDCAGAARVPLSRSQAERVVTTVQDLESVEDIATLVDLVTLS